MKVLILLIILSSVVFDVCNGKYRIFNGIATSIKKHPYQVGIMKKFSLICGGSIVNNNTIITAAHCVEDYSSEAYSVKVGSTKYHNGEEFKVKKIIKHPKYNPYTLQNDIAILKLKKSLTYNDSVKPIELQPKNKDIPAGTKAITSGWGSINPNKLIFPSVLQELEVFVLDKKVCNMYNTLFNSKFICAQSKGKSVCHGDSGGPLVINGKLVGITSHVILDCKGGAPYYFTKVASMRDFIDKNV